MRRTVVSLLIASFAQQSLAGNLAPNALPTGGNVTAGNAAISQSGNVMNVNQSSQRAVVNWQSFNVGKDATVNFNQPNAAASTLNVVNGASKSMINGAVNAPGQVIFVNNNGVVFGKNAEVNVGGLVATTMNVNQDEYMAGKKSLTYEGGQTGKVVNKGRITATSLDGYIALMAPQVKNEGVITAVMSGANAVALVSGQKVTLTFETGQALKVSVDASVVKSLIENKRLIQTNGGQIILAANSAQELMGSTIKNTGTASADGVRREGGQVFLVADNVTQSGTVSANSDTAAAGQVAITGKKITLTETSKTTATGATAGGKVLIGTDKVVPTQATRLAESVTISQGALVDVSATQNGNGGSISIWSSIQTAVAGTLKAMGGALGGNGGFIETSSKGSVILNKGIAINTTAPKGKSGTWVLDPIDLVIDSQAANVISNTLTDNNVTISVAGSACPSLGACTQNGTGALTIAAAIQKVSGLSTTLSLLSTGAFNLNANISGQNLNVIISSSIAYLNVGTTINAKQVSVQAQTIYANGNINASASDTLGGAISLLAQALYISGRLNASAGSNTSTTNTAPSSVTYNGQIIRREDLPTFLTAQNTGTRSTVLDQVFSTTAANDPNVAAPVWNPANQNNVIYLMADQAITLANNAQVIANGTNNVVSQIHLSAPTVDLQSGSLIQANGNNGPGGQVFISANQATFSGSITANSDLAGGSILVSTSGSLAVNGLIQANGNNGPGGSISLSSTQDIQINSASITANGSTGGGSLLVISSAGNTTLQGTLIQTNGSNGRGGSIGISGAQNTNIFNSSIFATGNTHGGNVYIGYDSTGSTSIPFSEHINLDSGSLINAQATNGPGGFVETSGHYVTQLLATIKVGKGGTWLIDPYDYTYAVGDTSIWDALSNGNVTIDTTYSTASGVALNGVYTSTGAGNITINGDLRDYSVGLGNTLSLIAGGDITINGLIAFGSHNVSMSATGNINLNNQTLSVTPYGLTMSAGGNIYINANIQAAGAIIGAATYSGSGSITSSYPNTTTSITATSTTTFATSVVSNDTLSFFASSGATFTVSGNLSGTGSRRFGDSTYTGTVAYTGTNTSSGAIAVNGGTLAITTTSGLGSAAAGTTIASGATLDLQNVAIGAETLTINGGTLATTTGTSSLSGAIALGATNSTLSVTGTQLTLSGLISGTNNGITKVGSGTLVLSGDSTYTGATNINSGTLKLASGSLFKCGVSSLGCGAGDTLITLKSSPLGISSISIAASGTLDINGSSSASNAFIAPITMSGVDGTSQAYLINSSTTSTSVYGRITLANASTTGLVSNVFAQASGGTLTIGSIPSGGVIVDATSSTNYAGIQVGTRINSVDYTGTVSFSAQNTYAGGTTVAYGTYKFTGAFNAIFRCGSAVASCTVAGSTNLYSGQLGIGAVTISGGGTIDLAAAGTNYNGAGYFNNPIIMAGTNLASAYITNSYPSNNAGAYGSLTIANAGQANTRANVFSSIAGTTNIIGGVISDATLVSNYGGVQIGDASNLGSVSLSNANTYSGGTTIAYGKLVLSSDYVAVSNVITTSPVGKGDITINPGATLNVNGHNIGVSGASNNPTITMAGSGIGANQAQLINGSTNTYKIIYASIVLSNVSPVNAVTNVIAQASGAASLTISGVISDGVGTNYSGLQFGSSAYTGTVVAASNSTYAGGTTVAYGTLQLANTGTLATSAKFYCGGSQLCDATHSTISSGSFGVGNITINGGATFDLNGTGSSATTGYFYNPIVMNGTNASSQALLVNSLVTSNASVYGAISLSNAAAANVLTNAIGQKSPTFTLNINGIISDIAGVTTNSGLQIGVAGYTGTVALLNLNNYIGVTQVTTGTLSVNNLANGGQASSIGTSSSDASNLIFKGGGFTYTGATANTDRLFTLSATGTLTITMSSAGALNFLNTLPIVNNATNSNTISFVNSGVTKSVFSPVLPDPTSGALSVIINTGPWELAGMNTYSGVTSTGTGSLYVSVLANGGSNSNIGKSTNLAANLKIGSGGSFYYTGADVTTDRLFTLLGSATIGASGSGTLHFSNTGSISGTGGNFILTLQGSGNAILDSTVPNGSSGTYSVTKAGTGTWTLAGANTYSGGTAINQGILQFATNTYFYCGGTQVCNASNTTITSSPVGKGSVTINNSSYLDLNGNGDSESYGRFYNAITLSGISGGYAYLINSNPTVSAASYGPITLIRQTLPASNWANTDVFAQAAGSATLKIAGVIGDSSSGSYSGLVVGAATINSVSYSGTVIFSGINTFLNPGSAYQTVINYGTLQIASDSNLGGVWNAAYNDIQLRNGGALLVSGQSGNVSLDAKRNISLGTGGGTIANHSSTYTVTLSSVISGITQLTIGSTDNLGTIVLSGSAVTASGSYTGPTSVTSGALLDLKLDSTNTTTTASFNSTYTGVGSLIVEPLTSAGTITLGGTGSTLNLPVYLFNGVGGTRKFADGLANIIIGSTSAGNVTVAGTATFTDSVSLLSGSNITINAGASVSTSQAGGNLVLAATGNFLNLAGSSALSTTDGGSTDRWIVYSASPSTDNFGASGTLVSDNKAYWGSTYVTLAPSSVGAGNRYVFNTAGTVTVTTTNATMTYGVPIDLSSNYTTSNASLDAAPTGTPYISNVASDLFATAPTITSTGNTATASVGQYDITASGAIGSTGFSTITYTDTGRLTVNPAVITLGVVGSKTYDGTADFDASPTNANVTVSGLVNGNTLATVTANSPNVSANGSNYFVSFTMGSGTASNYTLVSGYDASTNKATINPATLTVTANATNMTYGATALPSFTYSNGTLVAGNNFTGSLTSVAPVYNSGAGTFTANTGATYPITIGTLSAGSNYTISYTGANLTMVQAPLTVTAVAKSMTYGDNSLPNLTYTNSSLANGDASSVLTGILSTTATAYNGTAGSASNAGTYPISQNTVSAGNNYNITYTGANVTVDKATLTVTGNSPNMTYGATSLPTLSYGYSGYVNGDSSAAGLSGTPTVSTTATVYNSGVSTTGNAGATYAVTPSVTGVSSTNYNFATANGSLLMVAAPLTVTATAENMTYGATAPPTLRYTTSALANGNLSNVLSGSLAASIPVYVAGVSTTGDAGSTYTINQGTVTAGGNYTITYQPADVTVTKAVLTVAGNSPNMTYGATSLPILSYGYSGYVNGDSSAAGLSGTPTVSTTAPIYSAGTSITGNAGATYAVTPSVSGVTSTNYTFAPSNGTLTMVAAPLNVTGTKVYNADGAFVYTQMSVSGAQNGESVALTAGSATTSSPNVATYAGTSLSSLAIGVTGGNALASNYSLPSTGSLSITQATLTYAATPTTSIYGSVPSVNAGTVTGFAGTDTQANATSGTLVFSTLADRTSNVGSYTINGSGLTANNGNYNFVQAAGNTTALTVNPATLTYTATPTTSVYGATPSVNAGTITGFVNGQDQSSATTGTLAFATLADRTSNVGSYAINGSGLTANNGNYNFVQAAGNTTALTVNPATLIYTATPTTSNYGSTPSVNAGTITGFVNGQDQSTATTGTLLFGTTATAASNVGSYAINGSGLTANNGNYNFTQAAGNAAALTVSPAPLTVTGTKEYDGNGNFTYTQMSVSGAKNSETLALTAGSATTSGANIGSYASTTLNGATISVAGGNASAGNYTLPATGTLSITGRSITITADAQSTTYGSALNLGTTAFSLSGPLATGDAVTAVTLQYNGNAIVPATTNAATYTNGIVASGATGTGGFNATNYNITYAPANLVVNKATLTVTGNSPNMVYGATVLPTLSYSYSGYQNGETSAAGLTGAPTVSTNAPVYLAGTSVTGNAGATYAVTPSVTGVSSTNYSFTTANGTLTMTKATVNVTADAASMTYGAVALPNLTYANSSLANGDGSSVFSGALSTTATAYNGTAGSASNAGTYPVNQNTLSAGNNYNITYTGANVTVDKATLTVTGGNTNMTYGATSLPSLSYGYSGYLNGDSSAAGLTGAPTVSTNAPVYLANTSVTGNAGATYAVTPSVSGVSSTNYNFATTNGTLTMTKATVTVTANAKSMTYGASTLPGLTYANSSLANGDASSVFTGALTTAAPVYSVASSTVTGNAGATYPITVGNLSAGNNYNITYTGANVTVDKATLTVTGSSPNMVYGATVLPSLSYVYSGYVNGDSSAAGLSGTPTLSTTATVYNSGVSTTGNAGATYAVTPSVTGVSSTNYNFATANGTLTMTKATVNITANAASMTYGASTLPGLTYSYSGLANGNTNSIFSGALSTTATAYNGTAGSASNVGAYPISQNTLGAGNNYNITYTGANLSVGKATVTYSGSAQFVAYNSTTQVASNTYILSGVLSTDTASVALSVTHATGLNANRYDDSNAQLTGLASGNYQLSSVGSTYGILVINPASVTYRGSTTNTIYNASTQTASNTYTVYGVFSSDVGKVTVTATAATGANAGTYYDTNALLGLTGSATGNYQLSPTNNQYGSLVIAKAPLTITEIASLSGNTYSGSRYTGTFTTTFFGSDASHVVVSGMATGINVGTYTSALSVANATGYTVLSNYNYPALINANLVISPKPLTINGQLANNKVYDSTTNGVLNSANATLVGIVGSDSVALNSSAAYGTFADPNVANGIAVTVVGNALSGSAAGNYSLSQPTGLTANITQAPLTVTANNAASFVGQGLPSSYSVSYTGFVNGQNAGNSGVTTGSVTNSANISSGAGTYTLTPIGFSSNNYSISYVTGTYTIAPADTLLVQAGSHTSAYGTSASLTPVSVQYYVNGTGVVDLNYVNNVGNTYTYNDSHGGNVTFTLSPANAVMSSSNNLSAKPYQITGSNLIQSGSINLNGTGIYTGSLSVSQQAVTASASSVSKVYDGTTAMNGLAIALSPVVSGDQVTAGGAGAFAQSNTGSNINYSVTNLALSGADSGNYYLTGGTAFSGSNGVITPATLTYAATPSSSVYGSAPVVNAGVVSGFVSGENQGNATAGNLLFSTTATATSNVGGYAVNGSGLTANSGNYNFVQAPGNNAALTINPATLTYTATPATSVSGTTPIVDAGTITGYVNSQNQSTATTGTLLFSTNATSASGAGSYAINGSGLAANNGNYIFVQAPANATALTVTPAPTPTPTPTPKASSGPTVINCTVGVDDVDGQIRLEMGLCVAVQ